MNILNVVVYLLITFLVIATPICIVISIIFFGVSSSEQDPVKKKKMKKIGVNLIAWPIVLLLLTLVVWGLVGIVSGTAGAGH